MLQSSAYRTKRCLRRSSSRSSSSSTMFDKSGESGPPCGVPLLILPAVWAFIACAITTPAADCRCTIRVDCSTLSHDSVTCSGSPEVSSIAFHAQPLDLHSALLMDVGFAAICQLTRTPPASYPVLVHRLACLLHASFRPRLATRPLRFAITSRPSRCEEDFHLQAIDHARHTQKDGRHRGRPFQSSELF